MLAVWGGGSRGLRQIGLVGLLLVLLGLLLPTPAAAQAPTPTVGGQVQAYWEFVGAR